LAAVRRRGAPEHAMHFVVDSRAFLVGERKLGLGRSAATLVAATAALAPSSTAAEVLDRALEANALFQGGQGSGADIAAAVHGGVIEARRADARLQITRRALPPGLHLVAGWTGTSAHTPPLLARFAGGPPPPPLADPARTATAAARAAPRAQARALLEAVDRSAELLVRLGTEVGLPLVTPELAALVR